MDPFVPPPPPSPTPSQHSTHSNTSLRLQNQMKQPRNYQLHNHQHAKSPHFYNPRSHNNSVNSNQTSQHNNHGQKYQLSQHHQYQEGNQNNGYRYPNQYHQHQNQYNQYQNQRNQYQKQNNNQHRSSNEHKDNRERKAEEKQCYCGLNMSFEPNIHYRDCKGCSTEVPRENEIYFCIEHKHYLCSDCVEYAMKHCNKDPIDDRHCSQQLYFIYNKNKITGPLSERDIITLFVQKSLKEDKLYVMVAHDTAHNGTWDKLTFPIEIYNNAKQYKDAPGETPIEKCAQVNKEFKNKYCKLYNNLIENSITGRIRQIEEPEDIPKEEMESKCLKSRLLRRLLGKTIAVALTINIILHCVPTMIVSSIFLCIFCCLNCCFRDRIEAMNGELLKIIFIFFLYSGMAITPFVNVYIALNVTESWDAIQSWMVSYMVWGIVSLITSISHFVLIYAHQDIRILDNTVLVIMGVDFGDFDVVRELKGTNTFEMFGIIFIFPSLASLLPAAMIGFIANFYLEEKFDLKCTGIHGTTDYEYVDAEHLCFEEPYGCCQMISSHDIQNMYAFIGGLASNILAAWAFIRIAGYLLVNGFPKLSLFAKQTK